MMSKAGMGGSILKLVALEYDVHITDLTNGEPTPHGSQRFERVNGKR